MAITYPRARADFWDTLLISDIAPTLPVANNITRTSNGELVKSSNGDSLWAFDITISPESYTVAVQSQIRLLGGVAATFLATPTTRNSPLLDPLGTVAASTVTIGVIPSGNTSVGLAGLPAGYHISVDDYIGWVIAGKYHLHQFAEAGISDALGVLAALEVVPPIQTDAAVGQAVVLVNPEVKCILDSSATNEGKFTAAKLDGVTISAIQTLR